jgi:hypothetical protein
MQTDELYSTTDGGADTMVLGNRWRFIDIYPHRTINIVGFDKKSTKKYGCPVGTACTVMRDANDRPYLVIAHEAVQNTRSNTSLLSESQMRNHGLIVDSTSTKHIGIDGLPGTQSIYSHDKQIQFRLQQRVALMVLPHHPPTDDEIETLPRFELTSKQLWCPHHVYDDDTNTTTLDYSFDHINSHVVHAQKLNKTDLPLEHPDIIRRSDESTVSSHSDHFEYSTVYEFGDLTANSTSSILSSLLCFKIFL